jgi:ankyrin repeat protein
LLLSFETAGSPVHWAILNGRLEALKVLLQHGCSAMPPRPKRNNRSSAAVESPLEICERLYGVKAGKGAEMRNLLLSHRTKLEKLEKKRES